MSTGAWIAIAIVSTGIAGIAAGLALGIYIAVLMVRIEAAESGGEWGDMPFVPGAFHGVQPGAFASARQRESISKIPPGAAGVRRSLLQ
jgi:hypothetical protein